MSGTGIGNVQATIDDSMPENYYPAVAATFFGSPIATLPPLPAFDVLGVRVNAVRMSEAVDRMCAWADAPFLKTHFIAVTAMHPVAEARRNVLYRRILNSADLSVPDGMPLIWLARFRGYPLKDRVCGSDLMQTFCRVTGGAYRHFFYGGGAGVAERLANSLHQKYGIVIAGTYTPPFRALTPAEEEEISSLVQQSSPDVLWVGLSSPKQERWIAEHRHHLRVPVMLAVGAAFDMNSGTTGRAPGWMRKSGLEWLYRLWFEPTRLWKRYLFTIPLAMCFVAMEVLTSLVCPAHQAKPGAASLDAGQE